MRRRRKNGEWKRFAHVFPALFQNQSRDRLTMYNLCTTVVQHCTARVKHTQVVADLQTGCNKCVHKLLTSCVRTASTKLSEQVWNKLLDNL